MHIYVYNIYILFLERFHTPANIIVNIGFGYNRLKQTPVYFLM